MKEEVKDRASSLEATEGYCLANENRMSRMLIEADRRSALAEPSKLNKAQSDKHVAARLTVELREWDASPTRM